MTSAIAARDYQNLIDGRWVGAADGATFERISPAHDVVVGRYPKGGLEDLDRAVRAARRAFDEGEWPRIAGVERARVLNRIAEAIRAEADDLAYVEALESGKPISQARDEIASSADLWEYAATLCRHTYGDTYNTLGPAMFGYVLREPVGVVGMITPWNFPLLIISQKLPFALAVGCTAVVKPAELTPGTTIRLARIAQEAGLPDGVLNVVTGPGRVIGNRLAEHTDVDMISFTGSTDVGRRVIEASKINLKKVELELGGKNPQLVFADADLDAALDAVVYGVYFNMGECCNSGSRLLVQRSIADEFVERVVERARTVPVGDPLDPATKVGAIASDEQLGKILELVDAGRSEGADLLLGGDRLPTGHGRFIAPTVFAGVESTMRIAREEIFGPVLSVLTFDAPEDAVRIANSTSYGLSAGVWTRDLDTAIGMSRAIRAGTIWVNTFLDGYPELPFGGYRESGIGREFGRFSIDAFTELKSVQMHLGPRTSWWMPRPGAAQVSRLVPVLAAAEAVGRIPTGATVSVSSSSGLGCPDAVLRALGERYAATGEGGDLTLLHPIAAGDMYGIDGVDHLTAPGQIRRIIAGSYPSGPSSAAPPKIVGAIESNEIEAYNIPSGILFQLHRAAAVGQPGVLTEVGMDTFMDPRRHGGRMNDRTTEDIVSVVEFDGREWLYLRSIPVDVAIIRATTADEYGNLTSEDEGAPLGVLDQALAAHNNGGFVIAQVKRLARGRTLPAQAVRVPGIVVDAIVVAPDQLQTTQTELLPEAAGHYRAPSSALELAEWGPEKVIARRAAVELRDGEAVNLGFGISALVPRILVEEGLDGAVTWVIEQGAVGGVPFLGFAFGCAQNPDALIASPDLFQYLQGGGFDRAMLSFLEVDADGNVNVSRLAARPHVTAGVGGFVDITARAKRIVFSGYFTAGAQIAIDDGHVTIVKEGKHQRFVPRVQHVTFSGRRARELGQEVVFVTERCVIRLLPEGLTVTEIAPGISIARDIAGQTSLDLRISPDLRQMDPRLFRPDPIGLHLEERRA